jgi:hypothetical protein
VLAGASGACGPSRPPPQPIFLDGRAVAAVGDTQLAFTRSGLPIVLLASPRRPAQVTDSLGKGELHSPLQMQFAAGRWYVSDIENGRPSIAVFAQHGRLERRIDLARLAAVPHQFGVLPDGRIIVEGLDGRLLALTGDSTTTFVDVRAGTRSGLLTAASGGVVHAMPGKHITLYNQFGHIRWRIDWPWRETAFATDLTVDANGRIHLLAGVPSDKTFIVYTLSSTTGEVVRWSVPGPSASFVVDHYGEIKPNSR